MFVWHSIQAVSVLVLCVTGFGMYFADFNIFFLDFEGHQSLHELFGIIVCVVYFLMFVVYHLEANRHRVTFWWRTFLYRISVTREKAQRHEHHRRQVVLSRYVIIMFLVFPLLMLTGSLMLFPEYVMKSVCGINLYHGFLIIHIACAILMLLFLGIHTFIALMDKKNTSWIHPFLRLWYKM